MERRNRAKPLRNQLIEALAECRHQIDILETAGRPLYGNPGERPQDNSTEIALLEAECRRLQQAIADLSA
jgi:hypothetical protein